MYKREQLSNCCCEKLDENSDRCSKCKEHAEELEVQNG